MARGGIDDLPKKICFFKSDSGYYYGPYTKRNGHFASRNYKGEWVEFIKNGDKYVLDSEQEDIDEISGIDNSTKEGKLLVAAIAMITTESRTDQTPDQVLEKLNMLSNAIEKAGSDNG